MRVILCNPDHGMLSRAYRPGDLVGEHLSKRRYDAHVFGLPASLDEPENFVRMHGDVVEMIGGAGIERLRRFVRVEYHGPMHVGASRPPHSNMVTSVVPTLGPYFVLELG
jgi:hypothetical protein